MLAPGCLPCARAFGDEEEEAPAGQSLQQLGSESEPGSGQTVNQRALQWAAAHPEGSQWGGGPCKPADMTLGPLLPWVHHPLEKLGCLQFTEACNAASYIGKMCPDIHCRGYCVHT